MRRQSIKVEYTCNYCGGKFFHYPSKKRRYCSDDCDIAMRRKRANESLPERLWSKVDKSGDCWIWQGSMRPNGYGIIGAWGKSISPHRVAYILTYGEIPDGMLVCHTCDNPACCRPDHLFLGTQKENMADMHAKGRAYTGTRGAARGTRNGAHTKPDRRPRGTRNGNAKLTEQTVKEIRARAAAGESKKALAREYGVSDTLIGMVAKRKIWKHV